MRSVRFLKYDADLIGGRAVHGVVVIDWHDDGTVASQYWFQPADWSAVLRRQAWRTA
jgi:hypothetical protein